MGVLCVILSIVALLCGLLAPFLFGATGSIIAAVLAAVVIGLAVYHRIKIRKGGIFAIVVSVLAIILAFSMAATTSAMFKTLHEKAVEYKPDSLWAKISEDYNGGMMGLIRNMPKDEATLQAMVDEMNELNKIEVKK